MATKMVVKFCDLLVVKIISEPQIIFPVLLAYRTNTEIRTLSRSKIQIIGIGSDLQQRVIMARHFLTVCLKELAIIFMQVIWNLGLEALIL